MSFSVLKRGICTTAVAAPLRHIHFPHRVTYLEGLTIQEQFVRAHLDFKQMESKIKRHEKATEAAGETLTEYETSLLAKIKAMKPPLLVLTFEFEPTYTGGKRERHISEEAISRFRSTGAAYHHTERGGQVTFHGPGQMVAYPIIDLKEVGLSLKCYVSKVETAIQKAMRVYGIETITTADTGVWVDNQRKLAALGINARRGITSYGCAVNVSTDLAWLNNPDFVMCGLAGKLTVSMKEMGVEVGVKEVAFAFARELGLALGCERVEHMEGNPPESSPTEPLEKVSGSETG